MADPPLLTLSAISIGAGGGLLADAALSVQSGDRIALVGRNGSGKSTLMKVMAGLMEPDAGSRLLRPGASVAYMAQEPDFQGFSTLADFAATGLDPAETWRVDMAAEGVGLDTSLSPAQASGGERRRAALVRILARAPDLMLLDEPTNHLDITAIAWLEAHLANTRAAFVCVSHDRTFLRNLTRRTLWLDRGILHQNPSGFKEFEAWRDKTYDEEDMARHKRDRLIKAEARWAVEGISARRKRNQGRLRRLESLRTERRAEITRAGTAAMQFGDAAPSGRLVIDAEGISKSFENARIFTDFSIRVQRGERVAFVGPNGVGKTTLIQVLTGALPPDQGHVRLGTNLSIALFDQNRATLDETASLWDTLTGDASLGVSGRNDQVMVRGRPRHVVGYLKEFLFAEEQMRGPVAALSGGEKARLLLARLMARESNLLVLDEPTNDLDVETLDLLQEVIADYAGTVLLVSHDRDFIDRVATTTVAMEGDGQATIYAGGWSDYAALRPVKPATVLTDARPAITKKRTRRSDDRPSALSFTQRHRLEKLPGEIERLTTEIGKLEALLADPDLFTRAPEKFTKASSALAARQAALAAAEDEWLCLEERRETLAGDTG